MVTSFAAADDDHGLLNQYLKHLIEKGEIRAEILDRMRTAGWVGDVQFRPYTVEGPMLEGCPVKAVTLFDLPDLTELASRPDKYVVLLAGPCSECAEDENGGHAAAARPETAAFLDPLDHRRADRRGVASAASR